MGPHILVGLLLELRQLVGREGRSLGRVVVGASEQSFPAGQVRAVEQGGEALGRLDRRYGRAGQQGRRGDQQCQCNNVGAKTGGASTSSHGSSSFL